MNSKIIPSLFLIPSFLYLSAPAQAQGMLPAKKPDTTAAPAKTSLLIGDAINNTLTVTEGPDVVHPLLTYKAALDLLVVQFFSPQCAENQAQWRRYRRFYENYNGWRVGFVGVSVNTNETLEELQAAMKKAGLPYKAVRDDQQAAAKLFQVNSLPEVVILDEWGQFRYRGPLSRAGNAIEAIIGHEEFDPLPPEEPTCPLQ